MEFLERMYHEETMHVNNGRVNTKLISFIIEFKLERDKIKRTSIFCLYQNFSTTQRLIEWEILHFELSGEITDEKSGLLPLVHLLLDSETISSRRRVLNGLGRE